jgi:hypothetical protein
MEACMPDFKRSPKLLMAPKVLAIDFRPAAIPGKWFGSDILIQQYIDAMRLASRDTLVYQVVNKIMVPKFPVLLDGRQYTNVTWKAALDDDHKAFRDSHGAYMLADYNRIIQDFNLIALVLANQVDEVWMFGGPYFGFYESRMVGQNAFWVNGPGIERNSRRFVVMGFNYERSVREMVHDFGHRAESILARKFNSQNFLQSLYANQPSALAAMPAPKNDFERMLLTLGTVHRKPGGKDYEQDETAWVTALKPSWFPLCVDTNKLA